MIPADVEPVFFFQLQTADVEPVKVEPAFICPKQTAEVLSVQVANSRSRTRRSSLQ